MSGQRDECRQTFLIYGAFSKLSTKTANSLALPYLHIIFIAKKPVTFTELLVQSSRLPYTKVFIKRISARSCKTTLTLQLVVVVRTDHP